MALTFPPKRVGKPVVIFLSPQELKTEKVIVTSTRTNGVIENSPVKVEVLSQDEVNEEVAIRPGNISKLLGETSGVIVQQTSSVSGTVSFRLEGLPGNYTQLLKDGLPILSQFSSGLTLLQIPPLDLQQVEVVKGASSIFYGNGSVAGFVNIVTRKPTGKPEFDLVLDQTHRKGTDISSFLSNSNGKLGYTLLASYSRQSPVDVAGNGFTDIPKFNQVTINPKLFWNINKTANLEFGINAFYEDRIGGDISAIENGRDSLHSYFEKNKSNRYNTFLKFKKSFGQGSELNFNNNIYYYNRDISLSGLYFSGRQIYSFSELSYLLNVGNNKLVAGLNYIADNFKETDNTYKHNYYNSNSTTFGLFLQDDWQIMSRLILQPGLRVDYNNKYSPIFLPHISMMYKIDKNLQVRFSAGSGYKNANIFDLSDTFNILRQRTVLADNPEREKAESYNFDIGYKLVVDEFVLKFNQAFFYTKVRNVLFPTFDDNSHPQIYYRNIASLNAKGFDTNLYIALDELEFFVDYSYADVKQNVFLTIKPLELTPKNKLNLTLTYEEEGEWRTGLEAFYTGKQYLFDGNYSRSYWLLGAVFQKMFRHFSIIFNVENILNERQSKYEQIVEPLNKDPFFHPLYMPIDGIVANVAVWIRLKD